MAEQSAPPRASLVADDLVDLVRESLSPTNPYGGVPLARAYGDDDGDREWPLSRTDGRPVALDFAIVELLVEIRDALGDQAARLGHVHVEGPGGAPRLAERDFDDLGDRIAFHLASLSWLDPGRAGTVADGVLPVVVAFLREKGIAS